MAGGKSNSKKEVYTDKHKSQENRKISNSLTLHFKELEKENKLKPKLAEGRK